MALDSAPLGAEADAALGKRVGSVRPWSAASAHAGAIVALRAKAPDVMAKRTRFTTEELNILCAALLLKDG